MYNQLLKTFIIVVKCGSFLKASKELFISPTAVMKQINQLENQLGLTLLIRGNKGIHLTACGQSIYEDSHKIINFSSEAIKRAKTKKKNPYYQIRIGTSLLYPDNNFFKIINSLSFNTQDISFKIVPFTDDNFRQIGHQFDLAVGIFDSNLRRNYCQFLKTGNSSFKMAVSKNDPLASKIFLAPEDLFNRQIMIMKTGNSPINDRIRKNIQNSYPKIHIITAPSHYDANIFNYCEENKIVLLTVDLWEKVHPTLVTIPCWITETIPNGIIYPLKSSTSISFLINKIKDELKNLDN